MCLCMVSTIGATAQATALVDDSSTGSVVIDYTYSDDPLDDVHFKLYHVAGTDDNSSYEMTEEFADFEIDFPSLSYDAYWISIRNNLENYINLNMIEPVQEFISDEFGSYTIKDIEAGLYFISADNVVIGDYAYFSDPILIMVGYYYESEEMWMYHYTAQPKVSVLPYEENQAMVIEKVWDNITISEQIPESIEVELYCNGALYDTVTLSEENLWTYKWEGIDQTAVWAVMETTSLEYFEVEYNYTYFNFVITNTYVGPEVDGNVLLDESLPQTGTQAKMIPIVAGLGVALITVGAYLSKKGKEDES